MLLVLQFSFSHAIYQYEAAWVALPVQGSEKLNATLVRAVSIGNLPVVVDWLWMKFLQDSSLTKVQKGQHAPGFYDLSLATELDPLFLEAYIHGAHMLTIVRADSVGARDLLLLGERFRSSELDTYPAFIRDGYWSSSWGIPLTLAFVYFFDFDDLPEAAKYYRLTATLSGAPAYLRRFGERLQDTEGQYEVALGHVAFLLRITKEPELRKGYLERQRSLFVGQFIYILNRDFRTFVDAKLRTHTRGQASIDLPRRKLERLWAEFKKKNRVPATDPLGGNLSLDASGTITTDTQYRRALNLAY